MTTPFKTMKLADALALRKELNDREPRASSLHLAALTRSVEVQLAPGASTEDKVRELGYEKPEQFLAERLYYMAALEVLDAVIETANRVNEVELSCAVLGEHDRPESATRLVTVRRALLRRKTLNNVVGHLRQMHDEALKEVKVSIVNMGATRVIREDKPANVTYNIIKDKVDPNETAALLNLMSSRLRVVDSAIQTINWSVDVRIPVWLDRTYVKGLIDDMAIDRSYQD